MKIKIVAGGIITRPDGKFILVQEKKAGIAGLWNLPLGGLEGNESIIECAKIFFLKS